MFFSTHQRARPSVLLSVAMIFCLLITGAWVCTARAITPPAPGLAPTPHGTAGTYLALGDSIAFSYTPLRNPDNAANFAGYPDGVARAHGLALSNAACPGATSSYFVALTGADWNCHSYRSQYPLHVTYMTAQLSYAITYLKTHPTTRLVTLAIGYNDVFRLEAQCQWDPACIAAGLPGTLATLAYNLQMIYAGLRTVAGYHGRLVMLTYYALDAQNAPTIQALNQTEVRAAQSWGVLIADGYGAFARADAASGGSACAAGLLVMTGRPATGSATPVCDLHPSPVGYALLARAILNTIQATSQT